MWLSLVERCVRDAEVGSSNLPIPTIFCLVHSGHMGGSFRPLRNAVTFKLQPHGFSAQSSRKSISIKRRGRRCLPSSLSGPSGAGLWGSPAGAVTTPPKTLRRELGLLDAVGVGLGAIIGAGIFVVIGVAAGVSGPAFILALALAACAATFNALSSAELAARFPNSGGTYEYGYELLHPLFGFSAGWMFVASKLAAAGTVAIGIGGYFARLVPNVDPRLASGAAVLLLTIANYVGIRKAGTLNLVIVSVTILTLLYFVAGGLSSFDSANLTPFFAKGPASVVEAAAILFFAYTGYGRIATLAEEVREPERTIPRAIMLSLGLSVTLYAAVALVAVGAVGAEALAATSSPLTVAAEGMRAPGLTFVLGVGAVTAMLGVLLSQVLGISRVLLAMSRRGDLPSSLGHISGKFVAPDRAILLTGAIILLLAFLGSLGWIVQVATFTILLYYTVTNLAALKLEGQAKLFPRWVAMAGLASCLVLALSMSWQTVLGGGALLGLGLLFRKFFRRFSGGG